MANINFLYGLDVLVHGILLLVFTTCSNLATVLLTSLNTGTDIYLWLVVLGFLVSLGRAVRVWFRLGLKKEK